MNNKEDNSNKKSNSTNEEKPKIYQTEFKINRIHRISPANNINIKIYTRRKSDKNKTKNFNTAQNYSQTEKNHKNEIRFDEILEREKIKKEIEKRRKIFNEFKVMYLKKENNVKFDEFISNKINYSNLNYENVNENLFNYIINKKWLNHFIKYLLKKELSSSNLNEDFPGPINNEDLIINDDSFLKLNSEKKIIINGNNLDSCIKITPKLWDYLLKNYGGGPEIKIINNNLLNNNILKNEISTIEKAIHINLLFIPKKEIISNKTNKEPSNNINNPLNPFQTKEIIKILINNELKCDYKIQHIYFDITKTVQELFNYINAILNQYKNKFINENIGLNPKYNFEKSNNFVDKINYKLWLCNLEYNPVEIASFLYEQINKYEKTDCSINFINLDKIYNSNENGEIFLPYLLSDFIGYKIEDIFPNKYTKNFDNKDFYQKNYEDENCIPEITIIIEEFPYHFEEPKRKFIIKKCNYCKYRDYVFSGCICNKVFYCCNDCKKQDIKNHISSCKIGLINYISENNSNLYRIVLGRKQYYEKNINEKQNFPILGLTNLGSSCYMNSSLQCLFAIKELTNYYLYNFKEEYINKKNVLGTRGLLTLGYINLLLKINNTTNNKFLTPDIFRLILGLCSKQFEGNQQEDAHEFLNYLLDMLHEDINRVINKPEINQNENSKIKKNISDEKKSIIDWNNFLKRNQSVLIDLFYGQYKSSVICPICNFKSVNFNSFLGLELPLIKNKNYYVFNICFVDYIKSFPYICFSVVLLQKELNIYNLRKKISIFLGIDILEFEIVSVYNNEIILLFNISDAISTEQKYLYAYRINPEYFYSYNNERINEINQNKNNLKENHNLDYANLESNINKRKNEILELNENQNNNNNYLYLSLKFNDNVGLNNAFFQRCIMNSIIIEKRKIKVFEPEEIIYLSKNKQCIDIYNEIFRKYFLYIVDYNLSIAKKKQIAHFYNSGDTNSFNNVIKNCFSYFFQKADFNPSKIDVFHNFPDCPFILYLKNNKYQVFEVIPFSSEIDYNFILSRFYDKINDKKIEGNENPFNQNNIGIDMKNNIYSEIEKNILKNKINDDNNENNSDFKYFYNLNNEKNDIDKNNINKLDNNFYNSHDKDKDVYKEDIKRTNNASYKEDNNNKNFKGLLGGNPKYDENSENENEESENKEEEEDEDDNDESNDENEEKETENDFDSIQNSPLLSKSNSNNESKRSRCSLIFDNNDNLNYNNEIIKKSEKVENMDRLIVVWNPKYIEKRKDFNNINLFDLCNKIYENSPKEEVSIEKCFEEFSKEEKLDKENLWKCPHCEENIQANKKIELFNIPKILIIHLKRFNNNKKINTFINFPLTNLCLDKYINKNNKENNHYDLFGVINHYGSLQYGHYTAFCKNYHDNNWYEYNDRIVNHIPKEKEKEIIVNRNAYILFYRERKNDFIKWENIYNKTYEDINENNLKMFGEDFVYDIIEINENDENDKKEKNDIENNLDNKENKNTVDNLENIGNEDDNFSFKEGINNIIIEEKDKIRDNQTPKFNFINRIYRIEEDENINKNIFSMEKDNNDLNKNIIDNNQMNNNGLNRKCITKVKENKEENNNKRLFNYSPIEISKKNVIRITTYKKMGKKKKDKNLVLENKYTEKDSVKKDNINKRNNDDTKQINKINSNKDKNLLQYDIFNQSKKYFKLNLNKLNHPCKSVKSKELTNFILQLYTDQISDRIPRSKKLNEISNFPSKKIVDNEIINNEKENKKEKLEEKLISIKELNDNLTIVKETEIDLEDFVYNPFRNYYAKLMEIKN